MRSPARIGTRAANDGRRIQRRRIELVVAANHLHRDVMVDGEIDRLGRADDAERQQDQTGGNRPRTRQHGSDGCGLAQDWRDHPDRAWRARQRRRKSALRRLRQIASPQASAKSMRTHAMVETPAALISLTVNSGVGVPGATWSRRVKICRVGGGVS